MYKSFECLQSKRMDEGSHFWIVFGGKVLPGEVLTFENPPIEATMDFKLEDQIE